MVQQRRGGPPADAGSSTLEAHADSAAAAAVPGSQGVAVGGSAGVGIQCARDEDEKFKSRRREKNRKKQDRRNAPYDDEEYEETRQAETQRNWDRRRSELHRDARENRGDLERGAVTDNERLMRNMEATYENPGAVSGRSEARKHRDLRRFISLLRMLPDEKRGSGLRRSQRQGAFDEAQRTPLDTYGNPQDKYVGGHRAFDLFDLPAGRSRYAQPDHSEALTRPDGRFVIMHFNEKSDQLHLYEVDELLDLAERYADQAQRNVLSSGGRYCIRFAFNAADPEYEQAMLSYLFRHGTAIDRVEFGYDARNHFWREDYEGPRMEERLAEAPQNRDFLEWEEERTRGQRELEEEAKQRHEQAIRGSNLRRLDQGIEANWNARQRGPNDRRAQREGRQEYLIAQRERIAERDRIEAARLEEDDSNNQRARPPSPGGAGVAPLMSGSTDSRASAPEPGPATASPATSPSTPRDDTFDAVMRRRENWERREKEWLEKEKERGVERSTAPEPLMPRQRDLLGEKVPRKDDEALGETEDAAAS